MKKQALAQTALVALIATLAPFAKAQAQASASAMMAQPDRACAQSSDPNEGPYRFTALSSKYAGQCVDSNRFRAIQNLKIDGTSVVLNNYHHANEFWEARFSIAPENVEAVYLQIVRFPILGVVEAAHTQIRFIFKKPVDLTNQTTPSKKMMTQEILISFEAVRPKDQPYNFALGALSNYAIVGRATTAAQRLVESNSAVEQYELDITAEERSTLAKNTILHASEIGIKYIYNTLRPNCTTEVFDLIDALPRFQGKFPQFLTVISNDPVAQPSIDALQMRAVLKQRVQNFEDEAQGVRKTVAVPTRKTTPYLPSVNGRPWSLIVTLPNLASLSKDQQLAVLKVRSELLKKAPLALQGLGSAMMKEAGSDSSAILSRSLEMLQAQMSETLRSVNENLPTTPQNLGLYLVPFQVPQTITPLKGTKIPAALPFAIVDVMVDDSLPKSKEIYYHIAEGLRSAGDVGSKNKVPAYFAGSAIRMKLQRDHSTVTSQLLAGLNDLQRPFTMSNSQVNFSESSLKGSQNRLTRPILLLSHFQNVSAQPNPIVEIEFGSEGGLAGTMDADRFATFQIRKSMDGSCESQAVSAPTLSGTIANSALGKPVLDRLIRGKKVAFHILGAKVDLRTLTVADMDVRISTWPLECLQNNGVSDQFKSNANDMLKKLKAESMNGKLIEKVVSGLLH